MTNNIPVRVKDGYAYLYSQEAVSVLENAEKTILQAQSNIEKIHEQVQSFGKQVLERTQADWLDTDTESLGFIKNKPFILSNSFLPNALLSKNSPFEMTVRSNQIRLEEGAKLWCPNGIETQKNLFNFFQTSVELILEPQACEKGQVLLFFIQELEQLIAIPYDKCCVGDENTLVEKGAFWNTALNKIFLYENNLSEQYTLSLPLARAFVDENSCFKDVEPFYHLGLLGTACFVLPDFLFLLSDGVQENHTFKHRSLQVNEPIVCYQGIQNKDVVVALDENLNLICLKSEDFYEKEVLPLTAKEGDVAFIRKENTFFIFSENRWEKKDPYFIIGHIYENSKQASWPCIEEKQILNLDTSILAKKDLSNIPLEYDYVVESFCDENNGSFYRIYKSGWIEQGGRAQALEGDTVINFLTPFKNANYVVTNSSENPADGGRVSIYWHTSTNFTCLSRERGGNTTSFFRWFACGF